MDSIIQLKKMVADLLLRVDRLQSDVSRLSQQKVPDRFVPISEATRHLHCGRDWLVAQIKGGVLRPGIDFIDRTSSTSARKRFLVNPVSSLRWLNGAQAVAVKTKDKAILPA
tara:strand:+ start:405 stop:740 length:336 start_codon:yes stop_codon:yes gene_type:complete